MEQSQIRFGVIGTNFISDNFMNAAELAGGVQVQAVYSRSHKTGAAFAQKHGIEEVFTEFDAFVESKNIDAVYVASPNYAHCPQSVKAIEHGKHVLCEKPIASNSLELSQMKAAAYERGVVLLEAMIPAHDPAYQAVMDGMTKIGKVRRAIFEMCKYSSRYDSFRSGTILNAFNPALSNAAIMDIGVYCIHPCIKLFGYPKSIKATSVILHNGMEGAGSISLGYGDFQADIVYSKITESSRPCMIQGEDGTLFFSTVSGPKSVLIQYRGGKEEELPCPQFKPAMVHEIREFAKLIRNHEIEHRHLLYSEHTMKVIDEARRQNGVVFPADR